MHDLSNAVRLLDALLRLKLALILIILENSREISARPHKGLLAYLRAA